MNVLYNSYEIRSPTWTFFVLVRICFDGILLIIYSTRTFWLKWDFLFCWLCFSFPSHPLQIDHLRISIWNFHWILLTTFTALHRWSSSLQQAQLYHGTLAFRDSIHYWIPTWSCSFYHRLYSTRLFTLPQYLCDMGLNRRWLTSQGIGYHGTRIFPQVPFTTSTWQIHRFSRTWPIWHLPLGTVWV